MKFASLAAGAVLATALTASAFADAPKSSNAISITFAEKGKTICTMQLTEPAKGVLAGKSDKCGASVAGFVTGSGSSQVLLLASGDKGLAIEWFVEVAKKTFIAAALVGTKAGTLTGTAAIK